MPPMEYLPKPKALYMHNKIRLTFLLILLTLHLLYALQAHSSLIVPKYLNEKVQIAFISLGQNYFFVK